MDLLCSDLMNITLTAVVAAHGVYGRFPESNVLVGPCYVGPGTEGSAMYV